ncbi:hypothetical protein [Spirosoma oryzicola]|uniref:hypothetical protein n=1 Tax=Spirosoma oryzicola TaxID=2898794 RepID=UPI001E36799B|nr:hypothetical protein [Spirosoma oryzicola]UHG93428.1 hypothetical protein LQ777_11100 [Spirosoma oryzicola]
MNRFLVLLFSLLSLASWGQNKANIQATITYKGESYVVTSDAPKGYYALTSTGQAAFNKAVYDGVWNLTTADGCIIPKGTKPPKNKPTCSTTVPINYNQSFAAYQASGAGTTYDKPGASDSKIKDGELTYSVSSIPAPGSYTLVLSYQSNSAPPTALISVNNGSAQSLQLEATEGSLKTATATVSGFQTGTNSVRITPQGYFASDKIAVSRVGTTTVPTDNSTGCGDLQLAVSSPSVSCGASVQLTAMASGTAASGLQYAWSNGMSGTSITFNAPSENGSYPYTVTASKNGCSKSATATVTVTGCQTTTVTSPGSGYYSYRGDTYDYPSWPTASTADKFPVFENEFIKIQLALDNQKGYSNTPGGGGAIWKLWNKKGNVSHTLLYNPNRYNGDDDGPVNRSGFPNRIFWGQGLSDCLYKLPKPFYTDAANGAAGPSHDTGLGLNPNECGDDMLNSGELQEYHVSPDGQGFHNKTRPPIYGQNRFYLPVSAITMEKWVRLSGRALKLNYQANFNQQGAAEYADARVVTKPQETPCLYVNGLNIFKWYDGTNPYSNDGLTTIEARLGRNNANNVDWNGGRPGGQFLSEPWIWVGGKDGQGIGLMLKHNYEAAYAYRGDGGFFADNPHMGGSYATITASPQEILDHVMKYRHEAEVIVGTVDEVRAYVYAHSFRPDFTPRFKWNRAGREGWYLNSGDAPDIHTWDDGYSGSAKDGWKVYFGAGYDAVMSSPAVIYKADQTQTIYLRYKYSGKETQWSLSFQRNAQTPNGDPNLNESTNRYAHEDVIRYRNGKGNGDNQTVKFEVIPDGQVHTAVINLPSTWQGVINRINIRPHANFGAQFNAGENATLYWLNNKDEDPFPNN